VKSLGLDKVGSEVRRVTAADHAVLGGARGHDLRGSTRQGPRPPLARGRRAFLSSSAQTIATAHWLVCGGDDR
jgi:hypothetical protein